MDPKDILTVAPGGAAIVASWLNLIETTLSISLLSLSMAFIIWRWYKMANEK